MEYYIRQKFRTGDVHENLTTGKSYSIYKGSIVVEFTQVLHSCDSGTVEVGATVIRRVDPDFCLD